ncbi:N-acetylmuramoyl-L-alanine amidase [Bacillus phage DZ1]|uniref:N-acetylmuramoyl-L-alanine amidase n=1 Tax=Bacillus phage DZ1 TaxID=3075862 RepID=A0AA96EKW9_9CAUD|nr:N-acetylmuramoyl-L-alanine amidase [Bacillus phage DZ1]
MIFSLHGGHNSIVQGANSGNRKEHIMDRQVKDAVAGKLRALGHTVYDDTDEVGSTQNANLNNIVAKCNSHKVDLVVSFHLNAYNGSANGVEVCYYDQQALAAKVSAQLAKDIGWFNRGAKERKELAVLARTTAPAILLELGFIDNEGDMAKWNVDKIANSIVYALTGQTVSGGGSTGGGTVNTAAIQSGGFGFSEAPTVMGKMVEFGVTGKLVVQLDGLCYVVTDRIDEKKIWKLDNYFAARGWWFMYI